MYFNKIIPAALLIASATAKPMHDEKRQLGGLSPLLGVISQVLPQSSGTGAVLPGAALPGASVPSTSTSPSVSNDASSQASCDKAVQRINDAIQLSAALTSKNGGMATTQDILIVLAVLQKSLGETCNAVGFASGGGISRVGERDIASQQEAADGGPLTGIIGTGNNPNGILGDITGGGRNDDDENHGDGDDRGDCAESDDAECAEIYANSYDGGSGKERETSTEVLQARDTTALQGCTACEAALYSIVRQLQTLFKSSANASIPSFGSPRLTAAVQRLRMETIDSTIEKRCDGTKC